MHNNCTAERQTLREIMSTFNEFLTAHRLLVIPLDVKRKTWTRFRNHRDLTAMMKVAYELVLGYGQRERETDPKTVEEINNLQIKSYFC